MKQSTFARKVLKALEAHDWKFRIEDDNIGYVTRNTIPEVMKFLKSVDELNVRCFKENLPWSFLYFVWQGPDAIYPEGEEILCGHTASLSSIIPTFNRDSTS